MIRVYASKTPSYGASYLYAGPLMFMVQQFNDKTFFRIDFKFIIREHHRWSYELSSNDFKHHDFIRWQRKYKVK